MPISTPATPPPTDNPTVERILRQAREHFFTHGYAQCTMDELATELGMSKKTLYVHFAGKDEILSAVVEQVGREIRADADALFANRRLNFAEKLRGFAEGISQRLGRVNPRLLRDLQRFEPDIHRRISELREKNIPYIYGRFIEEGQLSGMVRDDIVPAFAVEFFLQAMQGLVQPASMERLKIPAHELLPRAIELFFGGLLTPAGRKEHEKLFPR